MDTRPTLPGGQSVKEDTDGNTLTDAEEEAARFVEELIYGGWHIPRPIHRRQPVQQRTAPLPSKQIVKPLTPALDEDDEDDSDSDEEQPIPIMMRKWKKNGVVFLEKIDEDPKMKPAGPSSPIGKSTDNSCIVKRRPNERKVDKTARVPEVNKRMGNGRQGEFSCTLCTGTFSRRYSLLRHTQNVHGVGHKGPKLFLCEVCGMGFKQARDLKRHMEAKHGAGRASVCPKCGKVFAVQRYMKEHQRRSCRR